MTAWPPQFLFAVCQRGAELALKNEVAAGPSAARPSFSRPGFVTFKLDAPPADPEAFQLPTTFARTWSFSLGKVQGSEALAQQTWQLPALEEFLAAQEVIDLHVWQRDDAQPGVHGFEPGPSALSQAVEATLRKHCPNHWLPTPPEGPRAPSRRNRWVLDVVLVEPNEWWIGCHRTTRRMDCWPGGVLPLTLPDHAASRAYLKMQEALQWSALPLKRNDLWVELGCAPGGTSQALLEAGQQVLGVDPAEVDPEVLADPHFTHLRRRSAEIPHKQLRGVQWLAADINAAPSYTLDAAEEVAHNEQANLRGMILTLKLSDWKLAATLPELVERVRGWGFRDVRTRQLAFNRQELCLVALRSRGQRRVRGSARRQTRPDQTRPDGAHPVPPPHLKSPS